MEACTRSSASVAREWRAALLRSTLAAIANWLGAGLDIQQRKHVSRGSRLRPRERRGVPATCDALHARTRSRGRAGGPEAGTMGLGGVRSAHVSRVTSQHTGASGAESAHVRAESATLRSTELINYCIFDFFYAAPARSTVGLRLYALQYTVKLYAEMPAPSPAQAITLIDVKHSGEPVSPRATHTKSIWPAPRSLQIADPADGDQPTEPSRAHVSSRCPDERGSHVWDGTQPAPVGPGSYSRARARCPEGQRWPTRVATLASQPSASQ